MDLVAYAQIDELEHLMTEHGIEVPRLRGIRLMKQETPVTKESMSDDAYNIGLWNCECLCMQDFGKSYWTEMSARTDRIIDKYMTKDEHGVNGIKWDKVHGKKRKLFKWTLKKAKKRVKEQMETFNKYCGQDVLCIHARIGGNNWKYYDGESLRKEPWFLEKVDDAFDNTYCDIYAKINGENDETN